MRNYLVLGKWNVVCDRCGFQFKNDQLKKEWTGLMVCDKCWEPRHPQTLIRVPKEEIAPPWCRPEPEDVFVANRFIETEPNPVLVFDLLDENGIPLLTES
jgi:hypothetical protein